ncbi:hypothetical protein D3H55_00925 [Bacillus salacetis]|uniref:Uncharacterized protein n=1 Tax=Bacillus salacetis TaxID=2315464 RepID=A0A3A1RBA5_9BACI|nr:hypothetical protein [Bacillus salacetis]RIW38946.1 hypothetical protein D3H55_00925 [Bacillus salacetis]
MKNKQAINEIMLSYLNLQTPKENRGNILVFVLILTDLIGVLPILAQPFSWTFFWPVIIPTVLIHLAAIPLVLTPYKLELPYYLFMGIYGIFNAYLYFLVVQKLVYLHMGVQGVLPFVMGLFLLIGLLVLFQVFNLKMLYSGTYYKLQRNEMKINTYPYLAAAGIGYVIAQFLMSSFFTDSFQIIIMVVLYSLISLVPAFFSIFLHKFFYLKKNIVSVRSLYPEFGLSKKARESARREKRAQ